MTEVGLSISLDEDLQSLEASTWTVAPIDNHSECPLAAQEIPCPPCFGITRTWHNTTGTWVGIRMFRDGVFWSEAPWEHHRPVRTVRGTLHIVDISVVVKYG